VAHKVEDSNSSGQPSITHMATIDVTAIKTSLGIRGIKTDGDYLIYYQDGSELKSISRVSESVVALITIKTKEAIVFPDAHKMMVYRPAKQRPIIHRNPKGFPCYH
jgi:4-hydroxyphenylpyruvate dioxygenase-like putative hemolysin